MLYERLNAIREELSEVDSLPELQAIWCHWEAECPEAANSQACMDAIRSRLKVLPRPEHKEVSQEEVLKSLLAQLEELRQRPKPVVVQAPRSSRKYKLLKTDVSWTSKPQVHAIMHILGAHVKPGDVVDECDIVNMMVANEDILKTKQGGKRVWDYYKGDSGEGLVAHGNLERL